jgi:hypothetical protein
MKAHREFPVRSRGPEYREREECPPADTTASYGTGHKLEMAVVFTSPRSTVAALHLAAALMKGLDGRIALIYAQSIPYPLPLEKPPILIDFTRQRLHAISNVSTVGVTPHIVLCRFRFEALVNILKPYSLIVIGCRKSRWPNWEKRLARKLKRSGYEVLVREV